jgi:DNA mismatch repair protein MutL
MIKVLDKSVSELIAAGEVIERPASVIKELIENSIDAGARSITVEIKNGGVSFMRITDDGCGISHHECPTAFLRHATSKVSTGADLEAIATLGFRGEALASVAAVARVSVLTKPADSPMGTSYKIESGSEIEHLQAACPDGTTIIIRDLFFNTPARLKFLKKDISESNYVQSVIDKAALINPQIAFRFIRDNNLTRVTPGDGKQYSAIFAVYGKSHAQSLIEANCSYNGIDVNGYISNPQFCRQNRAFQNFYVNSRYIRSSTCVAAVEEGYRNSIMSGKFPACVLNISINPADVDANVHPMKTEVRFVNDKAVFSAIHLAVKNAILNMNRAASEPSEPAPTQEIPLAMTLSSHKTEYAAPPSAPTPPLIEVNYKYINPESFVKRAKPLAEPVQQTVHNVPKYEQTRIIGELFSTYIVCERDSELILIDKHAADERLRFNQLKQTLCADSQLLLEPVEVRLEPEVCSRLIESQSDLEQVGLRIEAGEPGRIRVLAMPTILTGGQVEEVLSSVEFGSVSAIDEVFHRIACRSAIKAGDKSVEHDLKQLAQRVFSDTELQFCPHGRPISVKITKNELEKKFKRIL